MKRRVGEKERVGELLTRLKRRYPEARCSLDYSTPLQLLIATILSAQCTDERVNKVTPALFRKYPSAADYANADLGELEQDIHSTGFYRNKAKNIKAAAERIVNEHGGRVPEEMAALVELPGVARKTANVVLGNAFGKAEGVVVDTHVKRVAHRLGLTEHENPEKIEQDLMKALPASEWIEFPHLVIYHGRQICKPKPLCRECPLADLCPSRQD